MPDGRSQMALALSARGHLLVDEGYFTTAGSPSKRLVSVITTHFPSLLLCPDSLTLISQSESFLIQKTYHFNMLNLPLDCWWGSIMTSAQCRKHHTAYRWLLVTVKAKSKLLAWCDRVRFSGYTKASENIRFSCLKVCTYKSLYRCSQSLSHCPTICSGAENSDPSATFLTVWMPRLTCCYTQGIEQVWIPCLSQQCPGVMWPPSRVGLVWLRAWVVAVTPCWTETHPTTTGIQDIPATSWAPGPLSYSWPSHTCWPHSGRTLTTCNLS